jgi:hypothetical protein
MKTLYQLELDDVIEETDWVKDIRPISSYDTFSDAHSCDDRAVYFRPARIAIPAWIGCTLRKYDEFGDKMRHKFEILVLRGDLQESARMRPKS